MNPIRASQIPEETPKEEKLSLSNKEQSHLSNAHSYLFNPSKTDSFPKEEISFTAQPFKGLERREKNLVEIESSTSLAKKESLAERESLNLILESWIQEAPADERSLRKAAVKLIKAFFDGNGSELNLSWLQLSSLPNIWGYKAFKNRLHKLYLEYNKLTTPPDVSKCTNLRWLDLSNNKLTTPPDLSNCTDLRQLELSNNKLTTPPDVSKCTNLGQLKLTKNQLTTSPDLSNCTSLASLNLSDNQLTTPPYVSKCTELQDLRLSTNRFTTPPNVSNCTKLLALFLSNNQLTTSPDLSNCTKLLSLYLSNNQLTTPPYVSKCTELQDLRLSTNRFTTSPDLSNCNNLRVLALSHNRTLTGLPSDILNLPSSCTIELTGCGLAPAVLTRLLADVRNRTARGESCPSISYSMETLERGQVDSFRTAEEWLDFYYEKAEREKKTILEDLKTPRLASWLKMVSYMADFSKRGGEGEKALANKILDYAELASDPTKNFLDTFLAKTADAGKSCPDRAALAVLHLEVAKRLLEVDPGNVKELAHLLIHGVLTLELLLEFAKNKIKSLPYFDEIGIILAYPVFLKKELGIPIDVEGMNYLKCSGLSYVTKENNEAELAPEEKNLALTYVKAHTENREEVARFLLNQDEWMKALKLVNPRVEEILQARAEVSTDLKAVETYQTELVQITLTELEKIGFFEG